MSYYPVFLDVKTRKCLVVGGGKVGARKANTLLSCGAKVRVISKVMDESLIALGDTGALTLQTQPYVPEDLDGVFMVFCCTNNQTLNLQIASDAKQRGILSNVADAPDESDFILPSLVRRGDLTLAVSTSGSSPALAKKLRKDLSRQFGEEYGEFLAIMGRIRKKLLNTSHDPSGHKAIFSQLIDGKLLDLLRDKDKDGANKLITSILGPGFED